MDIGLQTNIHTNETRPYVSTNNIHRTKLKLECGEEIKQREDQVTEPEKKISKIRFVHL